MQRRALLILIAVLAIFFILPVSRSVAATGFITDDTPLWTTTDTNSASSSTATTTRASAATRTLQTTTTQSSQTTVAPTYQSVRYGYDELDRLQSAQYEDGTVISYVYDKAGNRTSKSTSSGTTYSLSITATSSGYGSIVPSGTIGVPSGSSQTFFIEQDAVSVSSSCPSGYTPVSTNNRCEKSPPDCLSGNYNPSTHMCVLTVYSYYQASCTAGIINMNTNSCEYAATATVSGGATYSVPVYQNPSGDVSWLSGVSNGALYGYASPSPFSGGVEITIASENGDLFPAGVYGAYGYASLSSFDGAKPTYSAVDSRLMYQSGSLYGYVASSPGLYGTVTTYSCPSGGTLTGTTCQITPVCPSGGSLSSTTCTITTTSISSPTCITGTYEPSTSLCYAYPSGTLTSLLVDNISVELGTLQAVQGGINPKFYYTFSNVTAPHTIAASFLAAPSSVCTNYPAQINGTTPVNYLSLQSAYYSAVNGDTIQGNMFDHMESLLFDRDVSVILDGGYSCDFSSLSGSLTIKGTMIISKGSVTVNGNTVITAP